MAKKKKKRSKAALAVPETAGAKKKPFNVKRALLIALSTLAAFALYETLISLNALPVGGIPIIMPIYFIIVTLLLCAIIFLNRGFSGKDVTPDMFSGDADPEHIKVVCENINRQKKLARKLMLVLLPFLLSIFFDMLYLFYGDFFSWLW
ncbi:MAG: hypothetical protein IJF48_05165 [Clostridia bacterium]|nr:hypothetical protein [Clostridia bacterium]